MKTCVLLYDCDSKFEAFCSNLLEKWYCALHRLYDVVVVVDGKEFVGESGEYDAEKISSLLSKESATWLYCIVSDKKCNYIVKLEKQMKLYKVGVLNILSAEEMAGMHSLLFHTIRKECEEKALSVVNFPEKGICQRVMIQLPSQEQNQLLGEVAVVLRACRKNPPYSPVFLLMPNGIETTREVWQQALKDAEEEAGEKKTVVIVTGKNEFVQDNMDIFSGFEIHSFEALEEDISEEVLGWMQQFVETSMKHLAYLNNSFFLDQFPTYFVMAYPYDFCELEKNLRRKTKYNIDPSFEKTFEDTTPGLGQEEIEAVVETAETEEIDAVESVESVVKTINT